MSGHGHGGGHAKSAPSGGGEGLNVGKSLFQLICWPIAAIVGGIIGR